MAVTVSEVTYVKLEGVKKPWMIPNASVVYIGDDRWLTLHSRCVRGMKQILMTDNEQVPDDDNFVMTMGSLIGLKALIKTRNTKHMQEFAQQQTVDAPTNALSDGATVADYGDNKRPRVPRSVQKDFKLNRQVIAIDVPAYGDQPATELRVLRPTGAQECLTFEFTTGGIQSVIGYLRHAGFAVDTDYHKKAPELPPGVCRKRRKYLAKLYNGKTKFVATITEARMEQEVANEFRHPDGEDQYTDNGVEHVDQELSDPVCESDIVLGNAASSVTASDAADVVKNEPFSFAQWRKSK